MLISDGKWVNKVSGGLLKSASFLIVVVSCNEGLIIRYEHMACVQWVLQAFVLDDNQLISLMVHQIMLGTLQSEQLQNDSPPFPSWTPNVSSFTTFVSFSHISFNKYSSIVER